LGEQVAFGVSHQLAWARWAASSSPYFAINRHGRLKGRGSAPLASIFHSKLVRRRRKKKKIEVEAFS